jgi:polyribonucleotide nucleotidyltransferase
MVKALEYSHIIVKEICEAQIDFIAEFKKTFGIPEIEGTYNTPDTTLYKEVEAFLDDKKMDVLYDTGKKEFQNELNNLDLITTEFLKEK